MWIMDPTERNHKIQYEMLRRSGVAMDCPSQQMKRKQLTQKNTGRVEVRHGFWVSFVVRLYSTYY